MIALISSWRSSRIVKRRRRTGHLSETDQRVLTRALQNMRMSCNSTYLLDHETDWKAAAPVALRRGLPVLLRRLAAEPHLAQSSVYKSLRISPATRSTKGIGRLHYTVPRLFFSGTLGFRHSLFR